MATSVKVIILGEVPLAVEEDSETETVIIKVDGEDFGVLFLDQAGGELEVVFAYKVVPEATPLPTNPDDYVPGAVIG